MIIFFIFLLIFEIYLRQSKTSFHKTKQKDYLPFYLSLFIMKFGSSLKKIPLLRFFMKEKYFTILLYICVKFMRFGGSNLGIT